MITRSLDDLPARIATLADQPGRPAWSPLLGRSAGAHDSRHGRLARQARADGDGSPGPSIAPGDPSGTGARGRPARCAGRAGWPADNRTGRGRPARHTGRTGQPAHDQTRRAQPARHTGRTGWPADNRADRGPAGHRRDQLGRASGQEQLAVFRELRVEQVALWRGGRSRRDRAARHRMPARSRARSRPARSQVGRGEYARAAAAPSCAGPHLGVNAPSPTFQSIDLLDLGARGLRGLWITRAACAQPAAPAVRLCYVEFRAAARWSPPPARAGRGREGTGRRPGPEAWTGHTRRPRRDLGPQMEARPCSW